MHLFNPFAFSVISLFLLFISLDTSFAQETSNLASTTMVSATEVLYEEVNPDGGFSFLQKRLGEKIKLFFLSFSANGKAEFYKELVNRRLAELKYVIEKEDKNNFEIATIRYSTTVGEWTEHILAKNLIDKKRGAVEVMTSHLPVVEKLMTTYDGTTAEWRFVKQDFDYLNIYISKLKD